MSSQALTASGQPLFRYLFEQASLGIAVENLEGKILLANPALCSMLGYTEQELCAMSCSAFANDEDSRDDWAHFQRLREGVIDHYSLEKRYIRKDGARIWGRLNVSLLNDADGGSPVVFAFVEEITERKQTEERLREYEKAVEGSEEIIAVIDREYRYLIANRKLLKLRNLTKEQVVGRLVPEVLGNRVFVDVVKGKLDECFAGKIVRFEMPYTYPETGERDLFITFFPIEGAKGVDRVACILQDITERKRGEEALHRSEERFRLATQAGKMFAYEWDAVTDKIVRSEAVQQVLGVDAGVHTTGQGISAMVHPEDRAGLRAAIAQLSPEKPHLRHSFRMVRSDGSVIWVERTSRANFDEHGRMLRIVGMIADITDRKLAEEALSSLSHKLIDAQEQERARIGRELHDDIGQRLALLAVELQQLQESSGILPEVSSRVGELHKQTSDIAADIQSLSHELHSAKLQYLGIVSAVRGFCREFGGQQNVDVDFESNDLPDNLSAETSLCIFRVLQEALHNSAKHSGVRHFEVRLWGTPDEIHLTVRDSGAGFDRDAARISRGLGLISMEERLKLVHGTLSIESQAKRGTSIHARVPVSTSSGMRFAG